MTNATPADDLRRYSGATHAERLAARARMIAVEYAALARRREEAPDCDPGPAPAHEPGMQRFWKILRGEDDGQPEG